MMRGPAVAQRMIISTNILFAVIFAFPSSAAAACCGCKSPDAPTQNICIQTTKDCATLKSQTSNAAIKNLADCTTVIDSSQCKPVDDGVCTVGPVSEASYKQATAGETSQTAEKIPGGLTPNVPIPGLEYSTELTPEGDAIPIPYFSQFVAAIQRYMIGVGVTAAAIMIVYGGYLYIVGSTGAKVQSGKEIIRNVVIGLLLLLGSYTILNVINPDLLSLRAIRIARIDPEQVGNYNPSIPIEHDESAPAVLKSIGTGTQHGFDPKTIALAAKYGIKVDDGIINDIITGAKMAGIDACLMLANCEHETRFVPSWQGWYAGAPKEKQSHFGACGIRAAFLAPGGPYYEQIRKRFPDFPELPSGKLTDENRLRIAEWLLANHVGDAYAASLMMLDNFKILKNEVQGVAAFKAGTTSIQKNAKANNCTPVQGNRFADAIANPQAALKASCIPHFVAIPSVGDPPKGCPEDKFICSNPKAGQNSSWVGTCSDGRKCFAMLADESVTFIMNAYPKLAEKYPNCK